MIGSDWLAERGRRTPAHIAVEVSGRVLDYAALDARVDALARSLSAEGAAPGETLAALLHNGLDAVLLAHAARRCGARLLALNTRLSAPEIAFVLADAGAKRLHHGDGEAALAREAAAAAGVATRPLEAVELEAAEIEAAEPDAPRFAATPCDPDAPSTLLYTSGTTGRPKGALLSPRAFFASAVASALHLGALPDDRWLACLPLFHVGGLSIVWRSVLAGSAVVVHERFDADRVNRDLDEARISVVSLTATMLARVLDARGARPAPRQLRFVLLGGGPCPAPLLSRARDAGFPVAPTYGLTEATSQVATRAPDAPQDAGLAPLPGTEVRIADEAGRWLPPGREGEICVRGPSLMTGYWRRPEATAAALRDGWLHTGDIGRLDAAGGLHVLDRRSDLIVSGGENVYPAEVEAVLLAHPAVAEAGVAAVADATWGARPAAWWVARPGADTDADALARFCRERLAGYKVPVAYRRVASLPRTAAGKLRRHALAGDPSADLV